MKFKKFFCKNFKNFPTYFNITLNASPKLNLRPLSSVIPFPCAIYVEA